MNKLLLLLCLFLLTACTGFQPVVRYQFYTEPLSIPVVRYETYRPQFYYYQPRPYYVLPNYGGYPQGPRSGSVGRR